MPINFYRDSDDHEPVKDWLRSLSINQKYLINLEIKTLDRTLDAGMGLNFYRDLGQELFEVCAALPNNRSLCIIFTNLNQSVVLLHGLLIDTNPTPKIPQKDIDIALRRKEALKSYQ